MKSNRKFTIKAVSLVVAGLVVSSVATASTIPSSIAKFSPETPDHVLHAKRSSWRDPAFGDMGWTHSSDWGRFAVKRGQTVTITAISSVVGLHPGITVWYRGKDDTAPNNYVVDHFYPQNANFAEFGAKDETSGEPIGNIVMKVVAFGYDQDNNNKTPKGMNGITDNIPGQVELTFKAPSTGHYIFVVGGFNPDASVDPALKHDINTNVSVVNP